MGDTLLGLSAVALWGLGASWWDAPGALAPGERNRGWHDSLFSSLERVGSVSPEDSQGDEAGAATIGGSAATAPQAETASGYALSIVASPDAWAGPWAVSRLAGSAVPLSQGLPVELGVTGGGFATPWLGSGVPFSGLALATIGESAGRSPELFATTEAASSLVRPVNVSFDGSTGQLAIRFNAGEHSVREAVGADGFLDVTVDGQRHSGNPISAAFDRGLAGATSATVAGIRFDGGGQDTLILGSQHLAGSFTVQATGATVVTQNVATGGPLAIQAPNITVNGAVQGSSVSLAASGWVTVNATGRIDAGPFSGRVEDVSSPSGINVAADVFVNSGQLHADGDSGGSINVQARNILNAGPITADASAAGSAGGQVHLAFTGAYLATTAAVVSASSAAGSGGLVTLDGGSTGHLYSSGRQHATGAVGGAVDLFGREVVLAGATVDASGDAAGGSVRVGGDFQGRNPSVVNADTVTVTPATTIRADAQGSGSGGRVIVWAGQNTTFAGVVSARGGSAGGFIEVSGKDSLSYQGSADAAAPAGKAGTLLLDPKDLVIADVPLGVFPQFDLIDPHPTAGSGFGKGVLILSNGNILVSNDQDDFGGSGAGAWYLFNGSSGALLGSLVGGGGVIPLSNGNYLVQNPNWNDQRGAVTWGNGSTGVSGFISDANSLVGSNPDDQVGLSVTLLGNGNYVVGSPNWNDQCGAVTWGNGNTGVSGFISDANSLVGSNPDDQVGRGVTRLNNDNYVVASPYWNNGRGAATWGNGSAGTSGTVSEANSLVGSRQGFSSDDVGYAVTALRNGNYLVQSPYWNDQRGAVTWGNGSTGTSDTISESSSLVGSNPNDQVGALGSVIFLNNGNYLVRTPSWNDDRGAVTWGNGSTGASGTISDANSLVGSNPGDGVGNSRILLLSNGNYVVSSPGWNDRRGAVTWGNGSTGTSGTLSEANSLVGIGGSVIPLSNGNYVVDDPGWNDHRGAVAWGNGNTGTIGTISDAFSLVGSNPGDLVGGLVINDEPVTNLLPLSNGNYVIVSTRWNGNRGAVTWGNGSIGTSGTVSDANSLVGSHPEDLVGGWGAITLLSNGNYVIQIPNWNDNRGAVTWGNGSTGTSGIVSEGNSLIGSNPGDVVGVFVTAFSNGNYVVASPNWNGARGAVTWGNGSTGVSGAISDANSLIGSRPGDRVGNTDVLGYFLPGITLLGNGNYVVGSPNWNAKRGAVTWGSGSTGVSGTISEANSLVGSHPNDQVGGSHSVTALSNGNYVVQSPQWNGNRGAATWGNGSTGISGTIDVSNSLVGSHSGDYVGGGVNALTNGNYVVQSINWNGNHPAVTWGNGSTGTSGIVSEANSLVSSYRTDYPANLLNIFLLSNGNYVVGNPYWNNRGAATWGNGSTGTSGIVSEANSVLGRPHGGGVGRDDSVYTSVMHLGNGNYVVGQRGALTWVSGTTGQTLDGTGIVTPQNSLLGPDANSDPTVIEDPLAQSFLPRFGNQGTGQLTVGLADPNRVRYAWGPAQTVTLTADFLTRTLNTGTAVVLQASNDITVEDPILVQAAGHGGALTLHAGRSILVNASITTDNGALTLIVNDTLANGVVDAQRDPGNAFLTMAGGTVLDTGTGPLNIELRDGAGRTNTSSRSINLQTITAGSVSVVNQGPSPGSDIRLASVTTGGPQSYANPNGTTRVTGNLTATDNSITFNNSVVLNAGLTLRAGSGTVRFASGSVSPSPGAVTIAGGVVLTGSTTFSATLNGTDPGSYSQLRGGGPIDLGGSTLSLNVGFEPPVGSTFEIFTNTGSGSIMGTFNGLDEGAVFTQAGYQFQITYQGGTGSNSVVLTRVA